MAKGNANDQPKLPLKPERSKKLDVSALESWLWEAACVIRGPLDAPKFKDYILPLIFLKRLSDVFDDEIAHLAKDFGDEAEGPQAGRAGSRFGAVLHPEEGSLGEHRREDNRRRASI